MKKTKHLVVRLLIYTGRATQLSTSVSTSKEFHNAIAAIGSLDPLFALMSLSTVLQSKPTARTIESANQHNPKAKRKRIQPDLPGTMNGALNPEAVPDTVAFELFMRSISDYPSERVFEDAGLKGDRVTNALG